MSGANRPARIGRARHGARLDPEQDHRHPRLFGGKRQSPARGKIERGALPPAFDDQRPQTVASCGICGATEKLGRVWCERDQQGVGIASQLGQSRRVKSSATSFGLIGPEPQDRCAGMTRTQREHRSKSGRAGGVVMFVREQLMNPPARQPAT